MCDGLELQSCATITQSRNWCAAKLANVVCVLDLLLRKWVETLYVRSLVTNLHQLLGVCVVGAHGGNDELRSGRLF